MSRIENLKNRLESIAEFRHLPQILQIDTRTEFSILSDYKGQSYIVKNEIDSGCIIEVEGVEIEVDNVDNSKLFYLHNAKIVAFIPIDGKTGLLRFSDSYCDAVFFDEIDFCFVEFKLNATSLREGKINKNRKKAIEQLSNTIKLFDEKLNKNYEGLNLEAYLCTPLTYPRNDASWVSLSVEFLESYGIQIYETNEKICK